MKKATHSKLDMALFFATRGFYVFPVTPNQQHPPLIRWNEPEGKGGPTTDADRIREWWEKWPEANIGIATRPSNLLVVDINIKNGRQGEAALFHLTSSHCMSDKTFNVRTPSGGTHYYFSNTDHTFGKINFMKENIGTGVDIICVRGYVIAPGSQIFQSTYDCHDLDSEILPAPSVLHTPYQDPHLKLRHYPSGQFSPKQLGEMLDFLDPFDWSFHEAWHDLLCASHYATEGKGLKEFHRWATENPNVRINTPQIPFHWDNLKNKDHPFTTSTLIYNVLKVGGKIPGPEFDQYINPKIEGTQSPSGRFRTLKDLKDLPRPQWLVQGLITEGSVTIIFGQPGTYKTFLSLHVGLCVTYGVACFGRKVQQGDVIYLAGESPFGFKLRTEAWEKFHGKEESASPFFIQLGGNPLNIEKEIENLIRDIRQQDIQPSLIIIDTLQIYLKGNENAADDMGSFVQACHNLRDKTGASVLIVHHLGKDETRGPRGHTALIGAADAIFQMTKQGDHTIVQCKKMKEASDQIKFALKTEKVPLDIEGDQTEGFHDSLVLISTGVPVDTDMERIRELGLKFNGKFFKELKEAVMSELGWSESTAGRKIKEAIGTGEDHAVPVESGRMWLEPHPTNPRGPVTIRYQEWEDWEHNEDFL